jgi:chitodextrinase
VVIVGEGIELFRRTVSGIMVMPLLMGMFVMAFNIQPVKASSETQLYLGPSLFTVALNSNFTISVNLDNVFGFYGFEFSLFYNTTWLNCLEVVVSESLLNAPIIVLENQIQDAYNSTHGKVHLAVASVTPAIPANGSGTLALITFCAKFEGNSTLHFSDTYIFDYNGVPIFHNVVDGYVICRDLCPEPYIVFPSKSESLSGNITLIYGDVTHIRAVEMQSAEDILSASFNYSTDEITWNTIDVNYTGDLGTWSIDWNTTGLAEGIYSVRVTMTDNIGQQGYFKKSLYYDPTPPMPELYQPSDGEEIRGVVTFEANTTASDIECMTLEYLNSSKPYVDQDDLGNLEQEKVGPNGKDGKNHFCEPTATANALWRIITKLRAKTTELIEIKKCDKYDCESEYQKIFNEHKIFSGNKDEAYYEQKGGKKYLTLLGLAVVLAKKMVVDKDKGVDALHANDGLEKFFKEQCVSEMDKYTITPGNNPPLQEPQKVPVNPQVGDRLEKSYKSGGPFSYLRYEWDGQKWVLKRWEGPCAGSNTGDLMINLKAGEAVIVTLVEADPGTDKKYNTADDKRWPGTGHTVTGKDFDIKKPKKASFVDNGKEVPPSELVLVKGTDENGCDVEFIEIQIGDKWYIITYVSFVSASEKYKKDLQCYFFTPIGKDYVAYDGWSVDWNTSTAHDGFYSVKATLTDTTGNVGTEYMMVYVNNNPPTPVTLYPPINITSGSVTLSWTANKDDDFLQYVVYQSNGFGILGTAVYNITDASITSCTITGLSPGTEYYFTVQVVDISGQFVGSNQVKATTLKPHGPIASFSEYPETPYAYQPVYFDASSSLPGFDGDEECPITEYHWDFGDGTTGTGKTIKHTYNKPGDYVVTLTVYAPGIPPYIDPQYIGINTTDTIQHVKQVLPVGGYSIPIQLPTTAKPVTIHIALLMILTAIFIKLKPKTKRKH